MSCCTIDSQPAKELGLLKNSSAPRKRQASRSIRLEDVETITTGIWLSRGCAFSRCRVCRPSRCGMFRSRMIRQGSSASEDWRKSKTSLPFFKKKMDSCALTALQVSSIHAWSSESSSEYNTNFSTSGRLHVSGKVVDDG